jgi:hypothetical protein
VTHDPLCEMAKECHYLGHNTTWNCHICKTVCRCDLVARARGDERAKLVEVMGQVSHQYADQGNRVMVFVGEPVNGSVLVWRDGRFHWENPQ